MLSVISHSLRLARAGLTLARYDVDVPPALGASIPAPVRLLGRLARALGPVDIPPSNSPSTDNAHRLATALTALGPAYIKLGQFLATRPDILGPELAADLRVLQDKLPPFPAEAARRAIEVELGQPLSEVFADFSPAVAAASIAQVHKARFVANEEAQWVAIKVLRPGIERAFARDLTAFAFAARMIERFSPASRRLEPVKLIETLAASVRLELDLRLEAAAASEVAEHVQPDDRFVVPATFWRTTTRRMLTTEWVQGIGLDDHAALETAGYDRAELAWLLLSVFLKQSLRDGLFHADMHPGNLFVTRAAQDQRPTLVAVDYGIVGRLDKRMQRFMAETLYGFITRDYRRIAAVHFEVGFVPDTHSIDEFAQALRSIGEPVFGRAAGQISMARLLAQLFEVTRLFDMRLQPQLILLQKTMVVVEGVARGLDPDLDIWQTARPVVEAWMTRELGPEARLQEAAAAAISLVRVAAKAPSVLEKMEAAADQLSSLPGGGALKLHPDSVRAIAAEEARTTRHTRVALWIGAAALAVIALATLG